MPMELVFVIGMAVLLILCIKVKANAFISLLATALVGVPMAEAIGTFMLASALIALCGFTGWVETLMKHVPKTLAAAMLGGVLLRFGLGIFGSLQSQLGLVALMLVIYFVGRRFNSRYTIPFTLLGGLAWAGGNGLIHFEAVTLAVAPGEEATANELKARVAEAKRDQAASAASAASRVFIPHSFAFIASTPFLPRSIIRANAQMFILNTCNSCNVRCPTLLFPQPFSGISSENIT